jgi:hypothetical protein
MYYHIVVLVSLFLLCIWLTYNDKEGITFEKKHFLGLITRCKDEFFIKEFCDYYISQGVDKIYVIDDDSDDKSIYEYIKHDKVEVIYTKREKSQKWYQMNEVNKLYKQIKQNFEWIISVDVDEFITTKKNINNTIRDELKTTFAQYDCVKVPWVMMSSNNIEKNPKSVLQTNVYRWNHDKKHPYLKDYRKFRCRYKAIEVKCIFKTNKFDNIDIHIPENPHKPVKIVNSINKNYEKLNPLYNNLRENDIKNGYLLCYHYRIISKENNINKLNKAQYKKYTLEDLNNSDYAEIKDETLKLKTRYGVHTNSNTPTTPQ